MVHKLDRLTADVLESALDVLAERQALDPHTSEHERGQVLAARLSVGTWRAGTVDAGALVHVIGGALELLGKRLAAQWPRAPMFTVDLYHTAVEELESARVQWREADEVSKGWRERQA